jgi:hypothetical protein
LARFSSETDFLLLCDSDGLGERSLNVYFVRTHSREKHTVQLAQFGAPPALLKSFGHPFSIPYCLDSVLGARLSFEPYWHCSHLLCEAQNALVLSDCVECVTRQAGSELEECLCKSRG